MSQAMKVNGRIRKLRYPVSYTHLGHADLVQTPTGDWYAVFLGKRIVEGGLVPLGRETFLSVSYTHLK